MHGAVVADAVSVVSVAGDLDAATAPELRQYLHRLLDDGATLLTVDLTQVSFQDSTTLGVFVSVHKRLHAIGSGLTIVSPHERLLRIFRMIALDRVFTVVSTLPARVPTSDHLCM